MGTLDELRILMFIMFVMVGIAVPSLWMIKGGKSKSDRVLGYVGLTGPFLFLLGLVITPMVGFMIAMVGVVIPFLTLSLWMVKKEKPRSDRVFGYIALTGVLLCLLIFLTNHVVVLDWLFFCACLMMVVPWVLVYWRLTLKQIKLCMKKREKSRSDRVLSYIALTGVLFLLFYLLLRFLPIKHVHGIVLDLLFLCALFMFLVGFIWIIAAAVLDPTFPSYNPFESQSGHGGIEKGDKKIERSE